MVGNRVAQLAGDFGNALSLKVALNGDWETALVVTPDETDGAEDLIRAFIDDAADAAFEVFFEPVDAGTAFLGLRLNGYATGARTQIIVRCLEWLRSSNKLTVADVVAYLKGNVDERLFEGVAFLEVGVEGLWNSIGPVAVWKRGERVPNYGELEKELAAKPELSEVQPRFIGVEVGFDDPMPHWIATQCSTAIANGFALDVHAVRRRIVQFACN